MLRFVSDKNKKIFYKANYSYSHVSEYVTDYFKAQKMCSKVVDAYPFAIQFFVSARRLTKCVMKLLILALIYLILVLIDMRLKKCVIKLLMLVYKHKYLFLICLLLIKC